MSSQAAANVLCVVDGLLSGRDRQTDRQKGRQAGWALAGAGTEVLVCSVYHPLGRYEEVA